jgi:hypothetical protein
LLLPHQSPAFHQHPPRGEFSASSNSPVARGIFASLPAILAAQKREITGKVTKPEWNTDH